MYGIAGDMPLRELDVVLSPLLNVSVAVDVLFSLLIMYSLRSLNVVV
jgi:hypothetical protein